MADDAVSALAGADLVVIGLPGVQRFIAEARSTSDVRAASEVFTRFAARTAEVCRDECGGELIFPAGSASGEGMPNRVVALLPAETGAGAARKAQAAVAKIWDGWVRQALSLQPGTPVPETPGMPTVQWVSVPAGQGGYPEQWREAQRLLAARRRVRDFPSAIEWPRRTLCSVGPRWPAEDSPAGLREHEKATLSSAAWVKRQWRKLNRDQDGFPSTTSIASAPFRKAVLELAGNDEQVRNAMSDLTRAAREMIRAAQGGDVRETRVRGLPGPDADPGRWFASTGGPWVYPDQWQLDSLAREMKVEAAVIGDAVGRGLTAAFLLRDLMKDRGVPPLAAYLAVIAADIDSMGRFLGGEGTSAGGNRIDLNPRAHQAVSAAIQELAADQRDLLLSSDLLGVPVYAGGDDLLAFLPAATALRAARECHDKIPPTLPTASTAVLFFHYHASLQGAVTRARDLLKDAKQQALIKHGLAVGYLRRSGVSEASVQPWAGRDGRSTADMFGIFTAAQGHKLSPRLLADLDRDAGELGRLSARMPELYRAELGRLVQRHTDGEPGKARVSATEAAATLEWLGRHEAAERLHAATRQARGSPEPVDSTQWPTDRANRLAEPDVAPALAEWPKAPDGCVKDRVLVYLATPALWPDGWRMPVPDGAHLVAAATGNLSPWPP